MKQQFSGLQLKLWKEKLNKTKTKTKTTANETKKFNSALQITTLEVTYEHIQLLRFKVKMAPVSAHFSFDF